MDDQQPQDTTPDGAAPPSPAPDAGPHWEPQTLSEPPTPRRSSAPWEAPDATAPAWQTIGDASPSPTSAAQPVPPGGYGPPAAGYGPPPGWGPAAAAGYPAFTPPPAPPASSGVAVTALVLGCTAAALALVPFVGLLGVVLGAAAVALGVLGLRKARAGAGGRGMAVTGVATGIAGVLLGLAVTGGMWWLIQSPGSFSSGWGLEEEWSSDGSRDLDRFERARIEEATALAPGEALEVGDVTYRLAGVDLDADAEVRGVSRWTAQPAGRYVLVDLEVGYDGPFTLVVGEELHAFLVSPDHRRHPDWCEPPGTTAWQQDPIGPGERATVQLCFDVPVEHVDDLRLVVDFWTSETGTDAGIWDLSR